MLEPVLVEVFGSDVGEVVLRWHVVDGDLPLRHQFSNEEEPQRDVLGPRAVGRA